ncbi:GmrSD restriction endonuclease domain-containing protein [Desulfonema magnum]|uniref:DUF262 n=1 Tax=Desulfonema magnum TaxID=45655 RepID=A0A975BXB9_9BACT|nr:DUF262 domain-containing protein [Desulfonema magnum]QTA93531.1 DUF262 [Desulfonema magnum]
MTNDRFDQGIDEEEILSEDEPIEKPYDPSKIQVDARPMTVLQVMRKIDFKEINLQPDFQRNIVWDDIRQSRLIESVLIRIPLPAFYLDARDDDEWLVVDGLQRLTTLDRFINKKKLRLNNLEFLGNQLNGKNFDELPRNFQRVIEEAYLHLYVIKPDTPAEVKFSIFYRINTGGMVLSPQEIRHCLHQGQATILLKELAESEEFLEATTGSINTKRMDDRECVLRYCAFHLVYTGLMQQYNKPDLNQFLSDAMTKINEMDVSAILNLKNYFLRSMRISKEIFGEHAFRKMFARNGRRNPINKALFEVWSQCLERFDDNQLFSNKNRIIDGFINAMNNDKDYMASVTQGTGGVKKVQKRFATTMQIINEALS